MKKRTIVVSMLSLGFVIQSYGQFSNPGFGAGAGFGPVFPVTELKDSPHFLGRVFVRYGIISHLQGEIGAGIGKVGGPAYSTRIIPIDYRFVVSPFSLDSWNPYLYVGGGVLNHRVDQKPASTTPGAKTSRWTAMIPGGVGLQYALDDNISFEASGGYTYQFSKTLNAVSGTQRDNFWIILLGLTVSGESGNADPDGDGLTNKEEKELQTDPKNPDTDGDGLSDGDEVRVHSTNPLKADSDGDGLKDGEEVRRYKTNPNKADTDGDGLRDGDEIIKYKTDPLKADTDGDGLSDGDEVLKYRTNPLNPDTDGDGLSDGDEVLKYKTDPLKADTDDGSVPDGVELARGTDPLNPADDIPKKEELKVEVGKAIILEGIVFKTGSAEITPQSLEVLEKAYNTLDQNPEILVEILGHTDNTGTRALNMKLSQARADAVKSYLVSRGIEASRIATKGVGPDKPIATNKTPEGRQANRRIEFFRTK